MTRPDSCRNTLPRVSFESPGWGDNGFSTGSLVVISSSGGLVTAVSGGKIPGSEVGPNAGVQDVARITVRNRNILNLILPPVIVIKGRVAYLVCSPLKNTEASCPQPASV